MQTKDKILRFYLNTKHKNAKYNQTFFNFIQVET